MSGYGLDDQSSTPDLGKGFVLTTALESTQSPIEWVPGALSSVVKRTKREA
jgi:hypothetical protein